MKGDYFSRLNYLSFDEIIKLNNKYKIIELNNVIEGFYSDFFSIALIQNESLEEYIIIYVGCYGSIRGLAFTSGRSLKYRDLFTFRFAREIENEFPGKNTISIFNTIQTKVKQLYESFGILCIPEFLININEELTFYTVNKPKIGIDNIIEIDSISFYRAFFNRANKIQDKKGVSKIYLMCEGENGYIKIGKTKSNLVTRRKGVAEPTLKARDPQIYLISAWEALDEVEKDLHLIFKVKRIRGEWFDLRIDDLKVINEFMLPFKMIELNSI